MLGESGKSGKITLAANRILLGFTLKVIEKERAEKSQKLEQLKRSGHTLLDQMGKGKKLGGFPLL